MHAQAATSRYSWNWWPSSQWRPQQQNAHSEVIIWVFNQSVETSTSPRTFSLSESPCARADFTFRCVLISFGSRSGASEYTFPFFIRMGSMDRLYSSSSIIMLVSSFSFSTPMSCRDRGGQTVRWGRQSAPDWAPPRPAGKAARRGAAARWWESLCAADNRPPVMLKHTSSKVRFGCTKMLLKAKFF